MIKTFQGFQVVLSILCVKINSQSHYLFESNYVENYSYNLLPEWEYFGSGSQKNFEDDVIVQIKLICFYLNNLRPFEIRNFSRTGVGTSCKITEN